MRYDADYDSERSDAPARQRALPQLPVYVLIAERRRAETR